jgi:hypothetical protein
VFDFWLQLVGPFGSTATVPLIITDRFDVGFNPAGASAVAQVKVIGDLVLRSLTFR